MSMPADRWARCRYTSHRLDRQSLLSVNIEFQLLGKIRTKDLTCDKVAAHVGSTSASSSKNYARGAICGRFISLPGTIAHWTCFWLNTKLLHAKDEELKVYQYFILIFIWPDVALTRALLKKWLSRARFSHALQNLVLKRLWCNVSCDVFTKT